MDDLFAGEPVPLDEQIREIERELETRRAVYPRWVRDGKLRYDVAKRRILILENILAELKTRPDAPSAMANGQRSGDRSRARPAV